MLSARRAVVSIVFGDGDVLSELRELEGDYEFIRELGRGGMAAVYLARARGSGRLVAVKAIRPRYAEDHEAVARFAREARTVADLDHPGVVRTYAVERIGAKSLAIVMQYVEGGTLRDALRDGGAFSVERAARVLDDVAEALRYAHGRGIVHRDVKPENIFLEAGAKRFPRDSRARVQRALLSDFGIARSLESDTQLTLTGAALGTPAYMSPEQIEGARVDGRSDVYSLGLVGWEMLVGKRPWEGDSLYSVVYKQKHEELPRLTELRPGIPAALLFAIEGALQKHRDERWASADEFLAQLRDDGAAAQVAARSAASHAVDEPTIQFRRPGADEEPLDVVPPRDVERAGGEGIDSIPVLGHSRDVDLAAELEPVSSAAPASRRVSRRAALRAAVVVFLVAAIALLAADGVRARRAAVIAERADSLATATRGGEVAGGRDTTRPGGPAVAVTEPDTASRRTAPAAAPTDSEGTVPEVRRAPRAAAADAARPRRSTAARTHADSLRLCDSPGGAAQRACLFASLADADVELNRVYRQLIREIRRQAGVAAGARDPASVGRIRAEQRAWLVTRDAECRRRTRGREGALWAPVRVRCLGEISTRRAAELAAVLDRLRAG